jgi:hypothetical protein
LQHFPRGGAAKICPFQPRRELGKTGETGLKAAFGTAVPFFLEDYLASVVEAKVN